MNNLSEDKPPQPTPVPQPRPRQHVNQEPNVLQQQATTQYENVAFVEEPMAAPSVATPSNNTPVPAPRQRTKIVIVDEEPPKSPKGTVERQQQDERYQNVVIVRPAPPSPAKYSPSNQGAKLPPREATGAGGCTIPLTDNFRELKIHNELREPAREADPKLDDTTEEEVKGVPVDGGKYKTLSPGDLFKTIGTASRMLTESIGERVAHKTKKVAHNVRNTGTSLVSWSQESRKSAAGYLLGKSSTAHNVSGKAEKVANNSVDSPAGAKERGKGSPKMAPSTGRPQSLTSPDVMRKIQFDSPLMNNAAGATYDTPKKSNKPTNLYRSPGSASTASPAPSSGAGSSLHVSSTSLASSEGGSDAARGRFQRNVPASQSLYSHVVPKRDRGPDTSPAPGQLARTSKNKSESNLYESIFYVGPRAAAESSNASEGVYGKLNIITRPAISSSSSSLSGCGAVGGDSLLGKEEVVDGADSEEDNTLHELQPHGGGAVIRGKASTGNKPPASTLSPTPTRTGAIRRIFSRRLSVGEERAQQQNMRSDSWNFYDVTTHSSEARGLDGEEVEDEEEDALSVSQISTPEPHYENSEPYLRPLTSEQQAPLGLLQPVRIGEEEEENDDEAGIHLRRRHDYDEVSIADIIDEFDPLAGGMVSVGAALEAIIEQDSGVDGSHHANEGGNLALIENLLGEESYSRMPKRISVPKPPQRSDSLFISETSTAAGGGERVVDPASLPPDRAVPSKPARRKTRAASSRPGPEPVVSQIVHQNLNLPSGSVDNLVELEERLIEPHLARTEEDVPANGDHTVDLSYSRGPQTNWYVEEEMVGGEGGRQIAAPQVPINSNHFKKRANVDPVNEHRPERGGRGDAVQKVSKTPFMPGAASPTSVNTVPPVEEGALISDERASYLPTYFEAIGGTDPLFERGLAGSPAAAAIANVKAPSVATKLLNALKRKPSFSKGDHGSSSSTVLTTLEMVPKPKLTERLISHKGHVLKFPSGKIADVLNELAPRSVVLRERIFQTYLDPQQTLPKEALHLRHILSVQSILQHKFAGEGRLDLHCFEVVLGLPKGAGGSSGTGGAGASAMAAASLSTSPDLLITSGTSANVKLTRQSYMFGTHKRSDRNLWMAKVLQSVTDVFGGETDLLREFLRAGWCYVKKSVSAAWAGAWLLLAKRKLYLYSYTDNRLEELDLRKARCIGVVENDPTTIGNLYVEQGPSLFIDCPPYTTLYFVMGSPRETQIWLKVIRQMAHKNGPTLHSQQLTRGDVPVLIDKCINFIYAHGSMSEGIYRKSGSQSAVVRILQLFNEDAFNVQLTRNEYNEYDVAGALKKFVRDLPGSFFGSYAASFVAIGSLSGTEAQQIKIDSYRQLLERLPRIEYCTLKKLLGHLAFIASLEQHNRMGIPNLAMIWGSVLLANASQNTERGGYHQQDADVVADLIRLYGNLFPVDADELYKEQLMLSVLKKYHAAAENLSDAVKHSGDLKVWITIDCDSPPEEEMMRVVGKNSTGREDKAQINVDVTPTKTAADICKELAAKTKHPWYKLTLYEVIANDALIRPIHYSEKVLEIVVRWTYWDESDRKNNYLTLKPTTTLNDVYRTIQKAPVLTPTMELKFAERKTKALRNYQLQLIGRGLVVLKKMEKKDKGYEELMKIDLTQMTAYIGCEPKRDCSSLRWAITLVDHNFKKRTRDSPFIGHVFGGFDFASQILWYSSILYSQYKDDILPSGDLFF
uniref:Rho-GAP domain-containing protein n=1 Tax=Anopheles epiroticus TaxID=199890 RepID=A0A182PTU5_9DIPT